jgi:hypothetical protein
MVVLFRDMLEDPRIVVERGGAKGMGGGTVRLDERD